MISEYVLLSIHGEHVERIESGDKTYEFRDYKPKKAFDKAIVYTTKPVGAITHVLDIGRIVEHPETIPEDGVGNKAFNDGEKTQYAYEIARVEKLDDPIEPSAMQEAGITPPQAYQYVSVEDAVQLDVFENDTRFDV